MFIIYSLIIWSIRFKDMYRSMLKHLENVFEYIYKHSLKWNLHIFFKIIFLKGVHSTPYFKKKTYVGTFILKIKTAQYRVHVLTFTSLKRKQICIIILVKVPQEIVHRRPSSTVFNAGGRRGESSGSYTHSAEAKGMRHITTLEAEWRPY